MDWWCLGLLMHEMITARHPFQGITFGRYRNLNELISPPYSSGPSHYDTLRNMVTKAPNIDERISPAAAAVIKGFLVKNPKGTNQSTTYS